MGWVVKADVKEAKGEANGKREYSGVEIAQASVKSGKPMDICFCFSRSVS